MVDEEDFHPILQKIMKAQKEQGEDATLSQEEIKKAFDDPENNPTFQMLKKKMKEKGVWKD